MEVADHFIYIYDVQYGYTVLFMQ